MFMTGQTLSVDGGQVCLDGRKVTEIRMSYPTTTILVLFRVAHVRATPLSNKDKISNDC